MSGHRTVVLAAIATLLLSGPGRSEETIDLGDIIANPSGYVDVKVTLEGTVARLSKKGTSSTFYYILSDNFGESITVRSIQGFPEVGKRYEVTGVVDIDPDADAPFISENSRILVGDSKPSLPPPPPPPPESVGTVVKDNFGVIVGGGLIGLALVILVVFLVKRGRGESSSAAQSAPFPSSPLPEAAATPGSGQEAEVFETDTIKIVTSPATMKFMPGGFEILSGEQKGKEIRLQGYPTKDGAETTFGRREMTGDRQYAHVQLKERTVSREQARLINKDDRYRLINLGETNPTQVNGRELAVDEGVDLADGDVIRFGEVELKFKL